LKLQKNHPGKILSYLILVISCSSCASVYVPSVRSTPLFTKRGQAQVQTSFGNGININAAYALTNHIAISAGGLYANNKLILKSDWRVHQSAEAALGVYGVIKKFSFECFGGYGAGKGHGEEHISGWIFFNSYREQAKASYKKIFIQPSMSYTRKRIEYIGSFRLSQVAFQDVAVNAVGNTPDIIPKKTLLFLEPSASIRFFPARAYPPLYIFWQVGFNVDNADETPNFRYSILHYQVGVGLKFKKE